MKTKIGTLSSESLLAALILVTAAGCTHYWERPAGSIAQREGGDRQVAAGFADVDIARPGRHLRQQPGGLAGAGQGAVGDEHHGGIAKLLRGKPKVGQASRLPQ